MMIRTSILSLSLSLFVGLEHVHADDTTSNSCQNMQRFCSDTGADFAGDMSVIRDPTQANPPIDIVGCIIEPYNPSWFFLEIEDPGSIELITGVANLQRDFWDVDFIIWGPYDSVSTAIDNCSSLGTPVECTASISRYERLTLEDVSAGEVYIMAVTNFDGFFKGEAEDLFVKKLTGDATTKCGPDQPKICKGGKKGKKEKRK